MDRLFCLHRPKRTAVGELDRPIGVALVSPVQKKKCLVMFIYPFIVIRLARAKAKLELNGKKRNLCVVRTDGAPGWNQVR